MARLGDTAESILEHLQLPSELLEQQASFYAGYAEILESRRSGTPSERSHDEFERIANPQQAWAGHAAIASTYRLAAENAVLVDTAWSMELAVRSALAYLDAGLAFGLFLIAGILDDRILLLDPRTLPSLAEYLTTANAAAPRSDPVQRAYLTMTLSARPRIREILDRSTLTGDGTSISDFDEDLSAYVLQPVGPQSISLGVYAEFADAIRAAEWPDELDSPLTRGPASSDRTPFKVPTEGERRAVREIGARCAALGRGQADSLRAAMRNRYLWEHGAAPVNIVDLEYVAVCGNAMRRYPSASWSQTFRATVTAQLNDDPLARISIWATERMDQLTSDVAERILTLLRRGQPPTSADA